MKIRFSHFAIGYVAFIILFVIGAIIISERKISRLNQPIATVPIEITKPQLYVRLYPIGTYRVGEWVCAWNQWTGVVKKMQWDKSDTTKIIYTVRHQAQESTQWIDDTYHDQELTRGKCDEKTNNN